MEAWVKALCSWFESNQRPMPWRENREPYPIWISEMMLQQTQVATVIPYFQRFMAAFPTVDVLAAASEDTVLKHWEGLGYYSRARNLHKAAKMLVADYKSVFPSSYEGLQRLPGVGPYAAAAIASIAFDVPVPVVDGNVMRVFTRFWGIFDDIRKPAVRQMLFDKLSPYIADSKPHIFNQAMMELGALLCTPKTPSCSECPLQSECLAYATDQVSKLPVKSPTKRVPTHTVVVGILTQSNGKVMITKRHPDQMLGGLWELPGGKCEPGESKEAALERELTEELGITVRVHEECAHIKHAYSHFKINLHAFRCEILAGTPECRSATELRWVLPRNFEDFAFPTANRKLFEVLKFGVCVS